MKGIFWIGLAVLVLGIASLLVPIPRSEQQGFRAGGLPIGIETHHQDKMSPVVGAAMILGGARMMIAQRVKA